MSKRTLNIGLDCDDVLFSCVDHALSFANDERKGKGLPLLSRELITCWGKTGTECDVIFHYFNQPAFYESQPALKGSHEFIERLQEYGNVKIITGVYERFAEIRIRRLLEEYPTIKRENIFCAEDKSTFSVDVMLDDCPAHIVGETRVNAEYPVIFRRPWNYHISGVLEANSYDDFLQIVKSVAEGK